MVITRSAAKKQEEKKIVSDLILESQESYVSDISEDSVPQVDTVVPEVKKEDSSPPEEVKEDSSSSEEVKEDSSPSEEDMEDSSASEEEDDDSSSSNEEEDEGEKDLMNKQNENDNAKLYYLASVLFSSILMFYMVMSNYKCYYFK